MIMKEFRILLASLLLCAMTSEVWAQSDYSNTHTSNITMSGGTECIINIDGEEYNGTKLGSKGKGGSCNFNAPEGTKFIHLHVAAWYSETPTFTYKIGTGSAHEIEIVSNDGISNNSPFIFSGDASTNDYYHIITLGSTLTKDTEVTLTSTGERCVIWGVNTEEYLPYTLTAISNDNTLGTVSVLGNRIIATPAEDCRYASPAYYVMDGEATVSQDGNVFTVTATDDCTIQINFEAIPQHNLSYATSPTGAGSISLGSTSIIEGHTTTATATPNENYKFTNWTITGTGTTLSSTTDNPTTVTMGTEDATITANFEAVVTHNINYSVNGTIIKTVHVEEHTPVDLSAPVSGIPDGYVFQGWVIDANKIDTPTNTDPSDNYITSATSTEDITYYAVMAITVPGEIIQTIDELTRATTGITGGNYNSWSGKSVTSNAVYAGYSAGGNTSIQLRSSDKMSGVISTSSGGKIRKVSVNWNSNTSAGRALDIYGKRTAYTATENLYKTNAGILLGSIVKGTNSELDIIDDYEYIGLRSHDGAMYLSSISITWKNQEPDTYITYCTTVPSIEISYDDGWASYTTNSDVEFPDNIEAYIVTSTEGSILRQKITEAPSGTPLVVHATTGADTYYLLGLASAPNAITTNLLKTSDGSITINDDNYKKIYVLTVVGDEAGFGPLAKGKTLSAGKVYLEFDTAQAKDFIEFSEDITGLIYTTKPKSNTADYKKAYNITGQQVNENYNGVVIVNGKKYMKK